jgi:hypothetical protein
VAEALCCGTPPDAYPWNFQINDVFASHGLLQPGNCTSTHLDGMSACLNQQVSVRRVCGMQSIGLSRLLCIRHRCRRWRCEDSLSYGFVATSIVLVRIGTFTCCDTKLLMDGSRWSCLKKIRWAPKKPSRMLVTSREVSVSTRGGLKYAC